MASIGFYGGSGGVTGANYVLTWNSCTLAIDCGLFQGWRFAEQENHKPFPYDPASIDIVCITHAHADHIGRLPKLVREGFKGPIYVTEPTAALMRVMLADAFKLMRQECERHGDQPLYNEQDLARTFEQVKPMKYNEKLTLPEGRALYFRDSAHILGSAMIEIHSGDGIIVFTGDLGNTPTPLLKTIYQVEYCDYIVMESVYGDRLHEGAGERKLKLERIIEDTVTRSGTLIIPTFALERTQALLAELNELVEHNRIPRIPIFLDSPLAINATAVYKQFRNYFNEEAQEEINHDKDLFAFPGLVMTPSREDSQKINDVAPPKIVLTGNPHGYGSRIVHHLIRTLPDPNSTVLFVGYARLSSMGRKLVDGAQELSIFGHTVPVRSHIAHISGYSAHADQNQLKNFVTHINKPIKKIFVTMGEPEASQALATILQDEVGVHATVPTLGDVVELN